MPKTTPGRASLPINPPTQGRPRDYLVWTKTRGGAERLLRRVQNGRFLSNVEITPEELDNLYVVEFGIDDTPDVTEALRPHMQGCEQLAKVVEPKLDETIYMAAIRVIQDLQAKLADKRTTGRKKTARKSAQPKVGAPAGPETATEPRRDKAEDGSGGGKGPAEAPPQGSDEVLL
jgi:hypothetical protein